VLHVDQASRPCGPVFVYKTCILGDRAGKGGVLSGKGGVL